jgi:CDP-glucose 4,6-dehydratase
MLGMRLFADVYRGTRVLVTGHTGFKGSWLTHWLIRLGAEVSGLALPPDTTPNHHDLLPLALSGALHDIRDAHRVSQVVTQCRPAIVFHLAAQPLVRRSYAQPVDTWATNVMGTAHVLEAARHCPDTRAVVCVTTDKCYENLNDRRAYRETDRLGGHDPYSASKAAAELVVASYRAAYAHPHAPLIASARAGNVIGGGDWSDDRLIPDAVRAMATGRPLDIRFPEATRPWQHVLESLSGYLTLGQRLLEGDRTAAVAWNFGPPPEATASVANVLARLQQHWPHLQWHVPHAVHPHEAHALALDSSRAHTALGWHTVWTLDEALARTAQWYQRHAETGTVATDDDLAHYVRSAAERGTTWTRA